MSQSMTPRQRLLRTLRREAVDCVPVCPDISNMIPALMTGKPFWDLYLYQDPPLWKAYIDSARYFGFDSLMDLVPVAFEDEADGSWQEYIVARSDERIITQAMNTRESTRTRRVWAPSVTVYYRADPPSRGVDPRKIGLPPEPREYQPVEGRRQWPAGGALLSLIRAEMGEQGIVGVYSGTSCLLHNEADIYDYYDDPGKYHARRDELLEYYTGRLHRLMALPDPPDFIATGSSGSLIFQTPAIFRELALPIVQAVTRLCVRYGVPSHIHSCGPETALVKMCAEQTDLTVIDPLEIPPMGDCDLADIKKRYGDKLVLKGNLHTTEVMLRGSPSDVRDASRRAIDDAAAGGGFILSTGDQCGRDTPFDNLFAMIETARTYGCY